MFTPPKKLLMSHKLPPLLTSSRSISTYTARIIPSSTTSSSPHEISVSLSPSSSPHPLLPRRDLICHLTNLLRRSPSPLPDLSSYLQTLTLTLTPSELSHILKSLRPPPLALRLFRLATSLPSFRHDSVSFNRILSILARSGDRQSIAGVLDDMVRDGVRGNLSTVNILVGVMAGDDDRWLELGRMWGLRFSGYTYKCLLQAYLRGRDVGRAVRVYEEMGRRGFRLDVFGYNMLLDALAKADKVVL